MATIATAYMQILPSTEGIKSNLEKELTPQATSAGKKSGSSWGKAFAKAGAVLAASAGTALIGIGKAAIQSYAEYEQLTGGIETLYKNSADTMFEYAQNAYKTAGVSANEYMQTSTSFAAALISSVGGDTARAAEIANTAIMDMSDNYNRFGTTAESVQAAFVGFAKGQYQLLDNLSLGYAGTKEGMEKLLADATKLSGVDYSIDSLADVYTAIHVIQESLDVTGTTAREAASTISGSINMMKASWANLLTGIADENADFGALIDNFVESAGAAFENIAPRLVQAAEGIASLIQQVAPMIIDKIPELVSTLLPVLLETTISLGMAILEALPQVVTMIVEMLPSMIDTIVDGIVALTPALIVAGVELFIALVKNMPAIIAGIVSAIPKISDALVEGFKAGDGMVKEAGAQLMRFLGDGISSFAGTIASKARGVITSAINAIKGAITSVVNIGRDIVRGIGNGISGATSWLIGKIKSLCSNALGAIKSFFKIGSPSRLMAKEVGRWLPAGIYVGFADEMKSVNRSVESDLSKTVSIATNASANISTNVASGRNDEAGILATIASKLDAVVNSDRNIYMDGYRVGTASYKGVTDKQAQTEYIKNRVAGYA